ncbi:hypothetical protein BpHYR1_032044 [Brachionus plicatilis]|uniref:FAM194 C-terminal domain-containing protein n=1 Tax=Brachionus plicatilis TaxID=10195 RepID=A0A3M7S197_BRAPC|nr:hypothetical protein BpHYR1_032044 [Brachionus plicatilis]
MAHMNTSMVFFYSQPEVLRNAGKRAKKILSDNQIKNLSKKIGDKYTSDLLNPDDSNLSLAARLAEFANQSVTSMSSSTNMSRVNHRGTIYTDTRLQALKFLTEEMLKELEEILKFYSQNELSVNLPGQVIYDLHSDWSDLTDGCQYSSFPMWQTKNGRESTTKRVDKSDKKDKSEDSAAQMASESGSDARKESHSANSQRKVNNSKIVRQNSKLAAISEKGSDSTNLQNALAVRRSSSTAKNQSPTFKSRVEIGSRLAHNTSVSTGYTVKFELSNKVNRDKGWTVLKIDREEELIDNSRRIMACLKNSLANIEEVRMFDIRSGLIKPCKIRFYGDHKKEQIEKYKATIIRPKKSIFAMSILRNEIPRPLDVEYMLEVISNPNLIGMTNNSSSLTTSRSSIHLNQVKQSTIQLPKPPDLINTQTNDGTTCIYYKNGQLAIIVANVFGYYIENPNNSSESRGANNNIQASINGSFTGTNNVPNMSLCSQNVKNSYTTVIYDMHLKQPKSGSSSGLTNSAMLGTNVSTDDNDESIRKILDKSKREQKLLAVISALGYCVVYRSNGKPRFICSENGGCLCNNNGSVNYQWKWDDIRFSDYERIKDELSLELNEFIWLSYKNPNNIKLRFTCEKEVMDFDLSSPKENYNRLHDLLNRSVCEFPMKSRLSMLKVSPNAKPQQISSYKQYHHQQQISNQNGLKASIYLGQNSKESEKVKIDKLLEKTVSFKDVPLMKDLLITQKKIRSLLEDWLAYSRSCLSILEPNLYILPDFPVRHRINRLNENHSDFNKIIFHRRKSRSVENFSSTNRFNFDYELQGRSKAHKKGSMLNKSIDFSPLIDEEKRSKSALISRKHGFSNRDQSKMIAKLKSYRSSDDNLKLNTNKMTGSMNQLNFSKSAIWSIEDLNRAKAISSSRVLTSHFKASINFDLDNLSTFVSKSNRLYTNDDLNLLCPVSLHQKLAFDKYDVDCRCKKQIVPIVNDVEFDHFLRLVPIEQIVVIAVIDSENPISYVQMMFTNLYEANNKNRVQPCKESIRDETRYLFYDVKLAADNSDHTQPMLITRHNVATGTVLMYKNSKLLFCDHIFNGYGYSLQDFLKQLNKSKDDAKNEKYLPYNFHFNQTLGKQGKRTAWGGQIDGNEETIFQNRNILEYNGTSKRIQSSKAVPKIFVNHLERREKTTINLPKINKTI